MAKLTRADVLKLAKLSRLELTNDEVKQFYEEISKILSYVEKLQSVDIKGLDPTFQVTGLKNIARPDVIEDYGVSKADLLKNVPTVKDDQIKVRRIL